MGEKKLTREELIKKAERPGKLAMQLHPFYQGKVEVVPKCIIRDFQDFGIWYTPGVAKPCMDIYNNPDMVFKHTNKANMIAVVSDGTRVLGLGDIGPEAGLPVMEGKALLFKYLGGVDAVPVCLDTKDPDKIIETVLLIQPSFGGINLEDISQPKCFYVLEQLRKRARIPVWHDDQQGTAAVTVAGLINAVKIVGKKLPEIKVAMIGVGAANVRIAHLLFDIGIDPKNVILVDSKGTLHTDRDDLPERYKEKWELAQMTNPHKVRGGIPEAMKGADVCIALSKSGPGVIEPEWVSTMAKDAILFTCANPVPEIFPWDAKDAGARIVATGRSDFPNQVNNSLGFPGIFRGTLDVQAKTITDEMCIAAALELAKVAEDNGLREDYIIPTMDEWEVFPREAVAVGMKAIEQGIARIKMSKEELFKVAEAKIKRAREETQLLINKQFIPPAPPEPEGI
ncbi:MAG: malate dehydrogenase [candidate division Zixibacteria bacterium 4484_93]|nr:MAG: malate dehydrogenase [candidate division Zixibacteria bacterium 4484_93]